MNPCKKSFLPFLFMLVSVTLHGQDSSYQNLFYGKTDQRPPKENDYQPGKKGFYLYRNCIYDFVLENKLKVAAKVIDVRNDSIYYTPHSYNNENTQRDTIAIHPTSLRKIRLIGDRTMGLFGGHKLGRGSYVFETDTAAKKFEPRYTVVYAKDSSRSARYELVPYMTMQGVDMLYEQCGITYYFEGIVEQDCADSSVSKPSIVKKWVWFSPTNATEVRGVNIGVASMSLRDSFHVKGVNLNADLLSFFLGAYGLIMFPFNNALINMPDTVDKSTRSTLFHGVSISAGGLMKGDEVSGVSINGGICTVTETNGLVITGTQNLVDEFNGVVVGGLRNKSIKGRGLQVGLLNICKDMKGIQIGLWNVNSKRRLPFINWNF